MKIPGAVGCLCLGLATTSTTQSLPRLTVDPTPRIIIGREGGDAAYLFDGVRQALRLPGGRVLVADGGSAELRWYDSAGRHLASVGRPGEGPGEFREVTWLRLYRGDSLALYDGRLNRTTILDSTGEVGRTVRLKAPASGPGGLGGDLARPLGVFSDGSFLGRIGDPSVGPGDRTRVERPATRLALFDPDGTFTRSLFEVPGDEQFIWAEGGNRSILPRAFARTTAIAIAGERIYLATNERFGYQVRSRTGQLLGEARLGTEAEPVTDRERSEWIEERVTRLRSPAARLVHSPVIRGMDFPETKPFHQDMMIADNGEPWIEHYARDEAGTDWTVFRGEQPRAVVTLPSGFRPTQIRGDEVVGVLRDALGVSARGR